MDLETLLTSTKWDILEMIAKKPMSPIELSKILNTTIANISQQLRLLQKAHQNFTKTKGCIKTSDQRLTNQSLPNSLKKRIMRQNHLQ